MLGFAPDQSDWVLEQMKNNCFQLESVYSHLAASEAKRPSALVRVKLNYLKS